MNRPGFIRFDGIGRGNDNVPRAWFTIELDDADGDTVPMQVPVINGEMQKGFWGWDGNEEAPTLNPSLRLVTDADDGYVAHFFLKAGVIEPCADQTLRVGA